MDSFKFKTSFAEDIFRQKYAQNPADTWPNLCRRLVNDVCGDRSLTYKPLDYPLMSKEDQDQLFKYMVSMSFVPGGRYLYYGGRPAGFFSNCFALKAEEDSREEWGNIVKRASDCLMSGGGIGVDYCLAPITPVLLSSGHWMPVGNLKVGDKLIGFNEQLNLQKGLLEESVVESTGRAKLPCYKIITDNGIETIASVGHKWVVRKYNANKKKKGQGFNWVETQELHTGDEVGFAIEPYAEDTEYNADLNWLAGFIDGEGWLSIHKTKSVCGFAQKEGPTLVYAESILKKYNILYNRHHYVPTGVTQIVMSGKWNQLKLLSLCQTIRLEGKKRAIWEGKKLAGKTSKPKLIVSIEFIGEHEVVTLGTSTKTLIANGFYHHNSILRPSGRTLTRTGGISSGPLPLMSSVNEIGRNVMQGGSRRSAIYSSLNWQHEDIEMFLRAKDWSITQKALKEEDLNFPLPLDMTNVSINWDTDLIKQTQVASFGMPPNEYIWVDCKGLKAPQLWYDSVLKMCMTGEPGHSYNFWENENETLRNACSEFTSEDDSDVCNLGSINLGNIESLEELRSVVNLASKFLVCGSIRGEVPYSKVKEVRERNRKIGLGLMGVHEWLLQRNYAYEVNDELRRWLSVWKEESEQGANEWSDRFFINRPKKYRAVAPAGTIGILASTTTGIEPLYAVAYKRRYLQGGSTWKYQYVIDATAKRIIDQYSISPDEIETSSRLACNPERRIRFQYEIQKYVDMGISSTINLPEWGSDINNEDTTKLLADTLLKYCHGLRGVTVYPNGARGGQPLTEVSYEEAKKHHGIVFEEETGKCSGGICSV